MADHVRRSVANTERNAMLSEYEKELLTAFVDGEMTRGQRKAVLRLLHQSSPARVCLRELQENVHLFKLLPHRKLEENFADHVLGEIAARGLRPLVPRTVEPARRRWPIWASSAAAAAILLAVGLWSNLFRTTGDVVVPDDLVRLELPEPLRKVVIAFDDFAVPEKKEILRRELERETSVHLDVSVRHGTNAVERFVQVLKDNNFDPVISPVAVASIQKKEPKTQYLVYTEGVRPEEVLALLQQLGADATGKGQRGFESVVLTPLNSQNRQQLTDLGVNVQQVAPGGRQTHEPTSPRDKAPMFPAHERLAVVLTNSTESGAGFAPEVQAFLDSRRELNPGTVQMLVVLTPPHA